MEIAIHLLEKESYPYDSWVDAFTTQVVDLLTCRNCWKGSTLLSVALCASYSQVVDYKLATCQSNTNIVTPDIGMPDYGPFP